MFIGVVKDRRAGRLKAADSELFNGAFWSAPKAMELGLIDGIGEIRTKMRELFGEILSTIEERMLWSKYGL